MNSDRVLRGLIKSCWWEVAWLKFWDGTGCIVEASILCRQIDICWRSLAERVKSIPEVPLVTNLVISPTQSLNPERNLSDPEFVRDNPPWAFNLRRCLTVNSNTSAFSSLVILSPSVCSADTMRSLSSSKHLLIRALLFRSSIGFITFLYWWVRDMVDLSVSGEDWLSIPLSEAMVLCRSAPGRIWTGRRLHLLWRQNRARKEQHESARILKLLCTGKQHRTKIISQT